MTSNPVPTDICNGDHQRQISHAENRKATLSPRCHNSLLSKFAQQRMKLTRRSESSFICGTVKKPIGSNVAIAEKSRVLKRISKKDGALQKHIKWLKELQEQRRRLDEKKEVEQKQILERRRLFREREAKKRIGSVDHHE